MSLLGIGILWIGAGCEYDAPTSLYDADAEGTAPAAVISQVVPSETAGGGVNEIEIQGENFAAQAGDNAVYFNNVQAELISGDSTKLVVFRPDITGDDIKIKVVVPGALRVTEHSPYEITSVLENFTEDFDDTGDQRGFALDSEGNFYTLMRDRTLHKQASGSNEKEIIADMSERSIGRLRIGPGGNLYYTRRSSFYVFSFEENRDSVYATLPGNAEMFDFDENGYAYFVGDGEGMYILKAPDDIQNGDDYSAFECLAARVYNGAVYVLAEYSGNDESVPAMAVWKNTITGDGTVSEKELVLNWSETAYADATPVDIEFSSDGAMYISSDHEYPIVKVKGDIVLPLYKGMIAGPVTQLSWGAGNDLYFYVDAQDAADRNIFKADMGQPGASQYGK